eukprot:jgi/Bigna1/88374/estExt_fgenesh1_pg.C_310090
MAHVPASFSHLCKELRLKIKITPDTPSLIFLLSLARDDRKQTLVKMGVKRVAQRKKILLRLEQITKTLVTNPTTAVEMYKQESTPSKGAKGEDKDTIELKDKNAKPLPFFLHRLCQS